MRGDIPDIHSGHIEIIHLLEHSNALNGDRRCLFRDFYPIGTV
jgi:hypothetical protein